MVKPLSISDPNRNGHSAALNRWTEKPASQALPETEQTTNGHAHLAGEPSETEMNQLAINDTHPPLGLKPVPEAGPEELQDVESLTNENHQLRALCAELEQALQEAAKLNDRGIEERFREYDALLEEKNEAIRQLHQELQHAHSVVADMEAQLQEALAARPPAGPAPREEELLALSEELERERRQLQEDEQTLMEQMREMEVSMARERAEMARQRNDLQRLQSEIRHELERLEKSGATVRKMEELKIKLSDVTTRRGMAANMPASSNQQNQQQPQQAPSPPAKSSLMGRLFGGGK